MGKALGYTYISQECDPKQSFGLLIVLRESASDGLGAVCGFTSKRDFMNFTCFGDISLCMSALSLFKRNHLSIHTPRAPFDADKNVLILSLLEVKDAGDAFVGV